MLYPATSNTVFILSQLFFPVWGIFKTLDLAIKATCLGDDVVVEEDDQGFGIFDVYHNAEDAANRNESSWSIRAHEIQDE